MIIIIIIHKYKIKLNLLVILDQEIKSKEYLFSVAGFMFNMLYAYHKRKHS